jgi:hypothetical protein
MLQLKSAPPPLEEEEVPSALPADEPAPAADDLTGDDEPCKSIPPEPAEGVGEVELEHGDDETRPR